MTTRRIIHCGICKGINHNRRTCPNNVKNTNIQPPETCPICYENIENKNFAITSCDHKFCIPCFIKASRAKDSCPLCRSIFTGENPQDQQRHLEAIKNMLDLYKHFSKTFRLFHDILRCDNHGTVSPSLALYIILPSLYTELLSFDNQIDERDLQTRIQAYFDDAEL